MRFFLDGANADEARRIKDLGLLDGAWLSVASAEAAGIEYRKAVRDLASVADGPVLVELSADDAKGMYKEARELAKLGKDIVIRLPLKPEGMRVARLLAQDQIAICASGCYTAAQALIAAKANVSYIAPAVGPLDDVGSIGMDLVEQIIRVYDNYGFQSQIVVSDARNPIHVLDAALMGADVVALPATGGRAALPPPALGGSAGGEAVMKASADRILYLSRVMLKNFKESRNLEQKADDETARRAVVRELTDSFQELDTIEEKVKASLAKRSNVSEKDREFLFSRPSKRSFASTGPE